MSPIVARAVRSLCVRSSDALSSIDSLTRRRWRPAKAEFREAGGKRSKPQITFFDHRLRKLLRASEVWHFLFDSFAGCERLEVRQLKLHGVHSFARGLGTSPPSSLAE